MDLAHHRLRYLDEKRLGWQAARLERSLHLVAKASVAQLARGDVDHHAERRDAFVDPALALAAGLAERPGADRQEEAGGVGERQERFGREHAVARMAPAQERLGTDHLARGDVDARLVDEEQLVPREAVAQLFHHRRGRGRVLVQHGGEELVAVAAELLRAVHRQVGEAQQRGDVVAVLRHAGDADARAGSDLVLADAVGLAELVQQLLRHRGGLAGIGDVLQQHAELVAADARHEVVAAHRSA